MSDIQSPKSENTIERSTKKDEPQKALDDTPDTKNPNEELAQREGEKTAQAVKKKSIIFIGFIVSYMLLYLISDRYTPYTTQARVDGYVVGVSPKVSGLITHVNVKNNQIVYAGDILFEIDDSQYKIAQNKAASDLSNANNQVSAGDAGVESAKANLLAAQANALKAQQDLTRLSRLYTDDPGTVSVRRIEMSRSSLEQAKAGVMAAKAEIKRAIDSKGGVDESSNAILLSAQSAVNKATLDLDNTKVIAASDGIITDLSANEGLFASAGNPVMTLVAIHDVWIDAEYTENNLGHMRVNNDVEIIFDSLPGEVFQGSIRSIGLGVSLGSTTTPGTLPTIDNNRDWLRQAQRFPVMVSFNAKQSPLLTKQLRIGGQASVITYVKDGGIMRMLGHVYIRIKSWLSYAY